MAKLLNPGGFSLLQARLLCVALVQAFHSTSPEAQEEIAELLRDPAKWALDEKLVLLAGEILGAAVNTTTNPGGGCGGSKGGGAVQEGEEEEEGSCLGSW